MQRPLLVLVALVVALGAALVLYYYQPAFQPTPSMMELPTKTLAVGTTTIVVEVANTDAIRQQGLGGRTTLAEGSGMWFVFDHDDFWGFWMKDTLIPLDILWVAADGTVVTIAHSVLPESYPQVFKPGRPARYVLEVPAGFAARHGIAEGGKVVVQ